MRTPADRFFAAFAALATVAVVVIMVLYPSGPHPPGIDHGLIRLALVFVLVLVAVVRYAGLAAGVAVTGVAILATVLAIGWLGRGTPFDADAFIDFSVAAVVAGGLGTYVGLLARSADRAQASEREAALVADLGVDLVPRTLDEAALGRLLRTIEEVTCSDRVAIFVPDGTAGLTELVDGRAHTERLDVPGNIARLLLSAYDAHRRPGSEVASRLQPGPLLASSTEAFVPVVSSSGVEGVLHAVRAPARRGSWTERETGRLVFAANLVGALIERDRLQEQVAQVRALEKADHLKANILLSVSHDLKTPLAAATASISGLLEGECGGDRECLVDELRSAHEDLLLLGRRIGELIDLARLEGEAWQPNVDWNDVSDLRPLFTAGLSEAGRARIQFLAPPDTPPFRFDLVQLGRALHHIVENALQYSPPDAPVTLEVGYDETEFRIAVTDAGPGLTPEDRDIVFGKFQRGSASGMVPNGSGLGLAIAASIVAGHGGRIEVEDVEPRGARFVVVLPREPGGTS